MRPARHIALATKACRSSVESTRGCSVRRPYGTSTVFATLRRQAHSAERFAPHCECALTIGRPENKNATEGCPLLARTLQADARHDCSRGCVLFLLVDDFMDIHFSAVGGSYSDYAIAGLLIDDPRISVPEPSTLYLLLIGLLGLRRLQSRKRVGPYGPN